MLPNPLPTDPDELEKLYQSYVAQDNVDQAELGQLMEARLRAWGYDPARVTPAQILGLMEETMNRLLVNLYGAADTAPDYESMVQIQEIIGQAEKLRTQINVAFTDGDQAGHVSPP